MSTAIHQAQGAAMPGRRSLLAPLRARANRWFLNRMPASDTVQLTQRNVYILPTLAGWMLAITLGVLLVASINYQLNLGYLLTFLLAGCTVVGMHVCHGNLRGLSLHLAPPEAVHAAQAVRLNLHLNNARRRVRHGIGMGVVIGHGQPPALSWVDVPAQGEVMLQLTWQPPGRGRHALPALVAQTLFPLGTFRVWTVWRPASTVLVYPAAEDSPPPLPLGEAQAGESGPVRAQAVGEFEGIRAYRRGDPMKTVVWKKAAQAFASGRDELVSRDASAAQRQTLWLDHAACGQQGLEARLSRLTAWVLMADQLDLVYGLRLPGRELAPDHGPTHRARCLEALALC